MVTPRTGMVIRTGRMPLESHEPGRSGAGRSCRAAAVHPGTFAGRGAAHRLRPAHGGGRSAQGRPRGNRSGRGRGVPGCHRPQPGTTTTIRGRRPARNGSSARCASVAPGTAHWSPSRPAPPSRGCSSGRSRRTRDGRAQINFPAASRPPEVSAEAGDEGTWAGCCLESGAGTDPDPAPLTPAPIKDSFTTRRTDRRRFHDLRA
jgi:hypothetical protein